MSALLKGPWALCYDGVIEDCEGGTVIGFPFDSYREFNQQSDFDKAKQRAIAAAPSLIQMVKKLMAVIDDGISDTVDIDIYQQAKGLLAKLDGGVA